ncbi:MAG TPA: MG2 domain-containing protein, partial [Herpetosiphonaceae bacterium]|nr:MG2 domain-containing protein [Herpetosiphonaceae bacterium]
KPSSEYAVSIGPDIADPYGNLTGQSLEVRFKTGPLPPSAQLLVPAQAATYNAANPTRVGLRSVNSAEVDFELYRLPEDSLKDYSYEWSERLPAGAESLRSWTESLQSPLDESVVSRVEMVEGGGALEPGAYLLVLRTREPYPQQHVLVVSDLNMTLKSAEREALVWVNELSSGQPRAGLTVEFYDNQHASLGSATTDAQGIARLDLKRTDNRGVMALVKAPFGAIATDWGGGTSAWDFGLESAWDLPEMTGHIYTDRPIYRPDQEVDFKGVVRAEDDVRFSLPEGSAIDVTITSPTGEEIFKDELTLSDAGSFAGSVKLAAGAALGDYTITAILGGDAYFSHTFQVAAYRAPEFEVTVTPPASELVRGEPIKATVEAAYFFGGPVASVPIQWNVLAEDYQFSPDWAGRYQFSASDDPWRCWECWWMPPATPDPILSGSGVTDAQGRLSIELPAGLTDSSGAPITRSVRLTVEATATGKDNQIISGRESLVVHGADRYVGLAPQTYVSKAGQEQKIDLVVADTQEKRVAGQSVQVEIFQVTWDNTYVKNDQGGGSWQWEEKRVAVSRQSATSDSNGEAVIAWTPGEGGSYQVVATAGDSRGRPLRSALFVWVAGDTFVSWRRDNNDRISLIADRTSYQPGETAEILIPSPFQGPHWALVTVERGGILSHEVRRMEGNSAIYRLPLTAEHAPNVYVSVVLFTGADGPTAAPGYKVGILPLAVAPTAQSLTIALTPSVKQAEPGQTVGYDVLVSDQAGQPVAAELSLDLVDKSVLSLLPRTPDAIREAFYGRRLLGVQTANDLAVSADRLQEELQQELDRQNSQNQTTGGGAQPTTAPAAEQAPGMAGGDLQYSVGAVAEDSAAAPAPQAARMAGQQGAAPAVRGEFADTAYWNASVRTDASGRARVDIKLPDNLTTWVIRGVGLTADTRVGEGLGDLLVTKPLLIRPVTPRFLVVDDAVELAANVSNNTDSPLEAQVWLTTSGLSVTSPLTRSVSIPARGEANVTWQAVAQDVEAAGMIFSATSGQYGDASKPRLATAPEGMLPVYRYSVPETVGTGGQLEGAGSRTEVIALPSNIDTRNGEVSVRLDPSLAAGMRDSLDYLEHYEYEGAEQTVSSFLPNVLTARALNELGVPNAELEARLPALIEEGLTRLTVQQHDDGGWGWWNESPSNPSVSAYVVFALLQARESGVEVKPEVISRGLDYLASQLVAPRSLNTAPEANLQIWLLYVLGEGGRPDQERLAAFYDARDKLSSYARALLAQALHASGADLDDPRIKTLLSDLHNAAIISANGAHWEEADYDW